MTTYPVRVAAFVAAFAMPALHAGEFDAQHASIHALVPDAPIDAPAPAPAPAPVDAAGLGRAVDATRLSAMRGGDGNVSTTTNRASLRGRVDGNTASHVTSGANGISDGAFGNAAGISIVIQNSGSNVLIQNSTIVNVQFGGQGP